MVSATEVPSVEEIRRGDSRVPEPDALGLPRVEVPSAVAPKDARAMSTLFFQRLRTLEEGTPGHQYARSTLIEMNLTLVHFAASRFRHRSEPEEDIVQVGTIGLIKAIDRFDLDREVEFSSFAVPYVVGEMKRFFRDTAWAVHVPRRLQELRIRLAMASEELTGTLGRSATARELADHLELTVEEVVEGQVAANGYAADSLDNTLGSEEDRQGQSLGDRIGFRDSSFETIEGFQSLKPLLEELGERDRRILELRFGEELTQSQIGERLGISQMHVSRLLSGCLRRLREAVTEEA